MKNLTRIAAILLAFSSINSYANTIDVNLDTTADPTVPPPYVGTGEISFSDNLNDGSYLLSSLNNLQITFTIASETFTLANLAGSYDPSASVVIFNNGTDFYFDAPPSGSSGFGGAVDFQIGGDFITTEPDVNGGRSAPYNLYFASIGGSNYFGAYGNPQQTVPEPTSIALLAAGLFGFAAQRKKAAQA